MEFEKAGTKKTPKTESGRSVAVKQFNKFLHLKALPSFSELMEGDGDEEVLCDKKLYQEFGTFLIDYATSLISDDRLSADNAQQILSNITTPVSVKYPTNLTWQISLDNWYTTLRTDIKKQIQRRLLTEGLGLGSKTRRIGRSLLMEMNEGLMKQGTAESEKRRCALNMTFSSIGRSGEVSLSTWSKTYWCPFYKTWTHNWGELKTLDDDPMNYFPDCESYLTCVFYSMSGYLIVGGPSGELRVEDGSNWYFPSLARNHSIASNVITKYVKESVALTESHRYDSDEFYGTCLRYEVNLL